MLVPVAVVIAIAVGIGGTLVVLRLIGRSRLETTRRLRVRMLDEAHREADATRREAAIEAREQTVKLRAELEAELRERRDTVMKIEERVLAKEEDVERRLLDVSRRDQGVADREIHLRALQDELKEANRAQQAALERISGLTQPEAKAQMLQRGEELVRHDLARRVRML